MKNIGKWITCWFTLCLTAFMLFPGGSAAQAEQITIKINGQPVSFPDMGPARIDGRVLVPIRPVMEAMGAEVKWNNESRSAEVALNETSVMIMLNSRYIQSSMQGEAVSLVAQLDVPAMLLEERTMIPLRASGELLGYTVNWDESTLTAELTPNGTEATAFSFPSYPAKGDIKQMKEAELDAFFLTNGVRTKHGASFPLGLHVELSKVAREKSKDMSDNGYFDHTSPSYGSPFDMMRSFGLKFQSAGENIAMGYPSTEEVIWGWEQSPGHLINIVSEDFEYVGIGSHEGSSSTYWTQQFMHEFGH